MDSDDLRMLGACDGYAHALIRIRAEIGAIVGRYAPGIHPRHVRKIAAREARLRPLRDLEAWLLERHTETNAAYEKSRKRVA